MKKTLLSLLILIFSINMYSQGLGLTQKEIRKQRDGQKYINDTTSMGYNYTEYKCTDGYVCIATTYVFDENNEVTLVMDLFDLQHLPETMKYLNNKAIYTSSFTWIDEKESHLVELKLNSEHKQFIVIYTRL